MELYKNKYLHQQQQQQQFQLNQQQNFQQQQQQKKQKQQNSNNNNNNNNNSINLDGTSLQLASKLRLIKENLEKSCANTSPLKNHQQQQQLKNTGSISSSTSTATTTATTTNSKFQQKSDNSNFFDYQKSQFNFNDSLSQQQNQANNDQFSDCLSHSPPDSDDDDDEADDANSTIIGEDNKKMYKNGNSVKQNDSFTSSTLSSIIMGKINGCNSPQKQNNTSKHVFVTPPDSLVLTPDNAAQLRKKYQIEKQYSIYSEDSLYKTTPPVAVATPSAQLQEATYSDNISRQSSIRSLISLEKKVNEMAARKQMIQQKFLNQPSKFHSSNVNAQNDTNSNSSQFDDNERLLLLNWENYDDAMSQSSASTVTSNQEPRKRASNGGSGNKVKHEQRANNGGRGGGGRPETRMGFRPGENEDDEDDEGEEVNSRLANRNYLRSESAESQIETSYSESIIIDNTKPKTKQQQQQQKTNLIFNPVNNTKPVVVIPITTGDTIAPPQFRTARLVNNRDSERRKTTSDIIPPVATDTQLYQLQQKHQQLLLLQQQQQQQQQPRNAISDINVANFEMNLNELKYKHNNYFNGLYGDDPRGNYSSTVGGDATTVDKQKRYQELSASINKIFTDLFDNFQKSKFDNNTATGGNATAATGNKQHQLKYSHSNKDSGFIQSPQQSKPSSSNTSQNQQQLLQQQQQQQQLHQQKVSVKPTSKTTTAVNSSESNKQQIATNKEISLLERYLNSEQQISYKYRQIINILERAYCENGYLIEDYSLAEYILNQEGISYQTFQQSIREKYADFEWTDHLLRQLYQEINSDVMLPHHHHHHHVMGDSNNDTYSPASSQASKSFRKVKDIKQASQQKRNSKLIQQTRDEFVYEDSLNEPVNSKQQQHPQQYLNDSNPNNTSIVESCGILMKTNSWRKEIADYFETQSVSKQQEFKRGRKGSLPEAKLNYLMVGGGSSNHIAGGSGTGKSPSHTNNQRGEYADSSSYQTQKHQNAFILEILRTSMFRSKSASDLRNSSTRSSNKSLDKIDYDQQHRQQQQNGGVVDTSINSGNADTNETDSERLCNYYRHSNTCTKCLISSMTSEQVDSHRGLIWQCADMCYSEFTNKYEELLWLLDGGNYSIQSKLREVEQRLQIDTKLFANNQTFYNSLVQDAKLGSSNSAAVQQRLSKQLNTLREKINELKSLRLYLLMCQANIKSIEMNNLEIMFNVNNSQKTNANAMKTERILQGKSVSNILISLYGPDAIRTGFVYQFYIVYRYFYSSSQLFEFYSETFRSCLKLKDQDVKETMLARTIDLMKMWVDGFYVIDFQQNDQLYVSFEQFIDKEVCAYNKHEGQIILTLLHKPGLEFNTFASHSAKVNIKVKKKHEKVPRSNNNSINSNSKKSSSTNHQQDVLFGKNNGIVNRLRLNKDTATTTIATTANSSVNTTPTPTSSIHHNTSVNATNDHLLFPDDPDCTGRSSRTMNICMSKRNSANDLTYLPKMSRKIDSFSLDDYPIFIVASQLTLLEWDNFLDIHPCHCLNSKAQGIFTDAKAPISSKNIFTQQSLFIDNYLSKSIYKMIQFNYSLTHWVSAEILSANSLKSQVSIISKFLAIAKLCCEWSNFSTAFSIYDGLQELIIKQLPAWKHVSNKTIHVLDRIASFKLLLQNEPLLLRRLCQSTNLPAIPCIHLFLVLVQQHELGSFQLVNGLWKWSKLSFLANLVDQIRIIQQHYVYTFQKHEEVADVFLQRIDSFKDIDLLLLAENNNGNFYHPKLNTPNIIAAAAANLSKKSSTTSLTSLEAAAAARAAESNNSTPKSKNQAYKR